MHKLTKVVKFSKSEAWWECGVWIGSIEASDETLDWNPAGCVKARAVTALSDGQVFEAKAIDEMQGSPWPPSAKYRGTTVKHI